MSYDARTIVLVAPDGTPQLLDLPAGTPRPLPGVDANDTVIAWSSDGRSVFVQKESDTVGRLERVDLATGRRILVRTLQPPDRTALMRLRISSVGRDGDSYAYTYWKRPSRLLVVRGVPE